MHIEGQLADASLTSFTISENVYTRDETGGYRIYSEVDDDVLTDDDADGEPDPEYGGYRRNCRKTPNLESDYASEGVSVYLFHACITLTQAVFAQLILIEPLVPVSFMLSTPFNISLLYNTLQPLLMLNMK